MAGSLLLQAGPGPSGSVPPPAPTASPIPSALRPRDFEAAAAALRERNCPGALATVRSRLTLPEPEATRARLILGLYAHACEEVALAEEQLFAARDPGGGLEDWRLSLLADVAVARGHLPLAQAALAKLLGEHLESPLRARALIKGVAVAAEAGDRERALRLIHLARREKLPDDLGARLETLAWEIGERFGNRQGQEEAARRLLVHYPLEASRLQVVEIFRKPSGEVAWNQIFTSRELKRRAANLLDAGVTAGAHTALEAIPLDDRDLEWLLLKARALTDEGRGVQALDLLNQVEPEDDGEAVAVEWARALAASDAAVVRRGRANLSAAERQRMGEASHRHLRRVVELGVDRRLARDALRILFRDLADEERFDEAMEILRRLVLLDPRDVLGARYLWNLGWREYSQENYTGAIGYWREIESLYPESRNARQARYWIGRAFEGLGHRERARALFLELAAADTTDFYRKYALARLHGESVPGWPEESREVESWPADPLLDRARLLTDLGLDDLALVELEILAPQAEVRAAAALRALILARKGERRESIRALRQAFPALGGPHQAVVPATALHLYYPLDFLEPIRGYARLYGLPTHIVFGIVREESAFDNRALSRSGARGLMQVMPSTGRDVARWLGVRFSPTRLWEPEFNVRLGTRYFRQVLEMFDGHLELALAGYNGGPYRIRRLWREATPQAEIDAFLEGLKIEESKSYVKRVLVFSDSYRQLYRDLGD